MSSIFRKYQEFNNHPNRNTFDWSFQHNGSYEFGKMYPVFFKKLMPGASISIKPKFSLHFMPMVFPVQTRMKARMHFFKVRLRSLWKDFDDWYTNAKPGLEPPYINFDSQEKLARMASTGSIGDYYGLPTVNYGEYGERLDLNMNFNRLEDYVGYNVPIFTQMVVNGAYDFLQPSTSWVSLRNFMNTQGASSFPLALRSVTVNTSSSSIVGNWYSVYSDSFDRHYLSSLAQSSVSYIDVPITRYGGEMDYLQSETATLFIVDAEFSPVSLETEYAFAYYKGGMGTSYVDSSGNRFIRIPISDFTSEVLNAIPASLDKFRIMVSYKPTELVGPTSIPLQNTGDASNVIPYTFISSPLQFFYGDSLTPDELTLDTSPWYRDGDDSEAAPYRKKISAFPYRAGEAVYNAFFRNIYNNPYNRPILDSDGNYQYDEAGRMITEVDYNQYIPTLEGGSDNCIYDYHYRYWEDDFLTTALPDPQMGNNPVLVGVSSNSGSDPFLSLRDENGKIFRIKPVYSEDGNTIETVEYELVDSSEFSRLSLDTMAQSGISIPDLRAANALQRWLELNARRGLRFKDHIKGHFNVDIRFDELNMPEFIGGISKDVTMNQVNQTTSRTSDGTGSFEDVLGSFAGQAGVYGDSPNAIRCFCDEPCVIIGFLSVVPVANYSQLLPKYFTDRDILDEYFPEFANISMQPILMSEVAPLQAFKENPASLNDTFGYQRPWYHYLAQTDEVHGLMRTQYRNFVINRAFDEAPRLSESFLLVDPNQVNDVFSVTESTDKIIGQIWFDCVAKLPIPRNGQPRIEQ